MSENKNKQEIDNDNDKQSLDNEYIEIKKIAYKIIEVYLKHGRHDKAERMKKLLELIKDKNTRDKKLSMVANKMLDTMITLIDSGDLASALKYFTRCLDEPDTILAYVYMFRNGYKELMVSITAKSIQLITKIAEKGVL